MLLPAMKDVFTRSDEIHKYKTRQAKLLHVPISDNYIEGYVGLVVCIST